VHSLAAKLTVIFSKSKKYYNEVLHSFAADGLDLDSDVKSMETEANVEQALIPMLQQKIVHLKKEIELSRMKSQSTQVQWYAIRKNVACCH
jgi:lipid II:glycine glycyltransferase (peptidoglycan interpeptide bridge formation enzyme)